MPKENEKIIKPIDTLFLPDRNKDWIFKKFIEFCEVS